MSHDIDAAQEIRDERYALWEAFVQGRCLDSAPLDPAIVRSWQRSTLRLDPYASPRLTILREDALERVLATHVDLVAIARPFMEDIHQFVEGVGCAVLLADSTSCILDVLGDAREVATLYTSNIRSGAYWDEGRAGTNALALALIEAMPVQVAGPEHFFAAHHGFSWAAAPIHEVKGRIVGVVAVATLGAKIPPFALGLVMAAAKAISNQLQASLFLREANRRLAELHSVFAAISEGVLCWDQAGKITHINERASELLQLQPSSVLGCALEETLRLPQVVTEAVQEGRSLQDVEATFVRDEQLLDTLISLRPIYEGEWGPVGYIATLHSLDRVRQLVHRQVGAQATLTLDNLHGHSVTMRKIRRQARLAARGTAPVLLRGEPGVGKDPLAQAIHNDSDRARGPFVAIHCRAIPPELMASEILGYEGGAFSNVSAEGRPSKFELADGGTLLLLEVEHLTLEMQAALVQVMGSGLVMRLGSTRPIPINVRIIATTSVELEQLVAEGSFHADLYYRFGVFELDLPPLRHRVEDIPVLVEQVCARVSKQVDQTVQLGEGVLEVLMRYPWPGNVRELSNVLERAVLLNEDGTIRIEDFPLSVRTARVVGLSSSQPGAVRSFEEMEQEAILRAGWAHKGRVTQMAEQLGISRTTLWRKMRRFDITPDHFKHRPAPRMQETG